MPPQLVTPELRDFQKKGAYFLTQQAYLFLGDDTGLGKSAQGLIAAEALKYKRILVLGPKIGAVSWRIEQSKWQRTPRAHLQYSPKLTAIPTGPLLMFLQYSVLSTPGSTHALSLIKRTEPFDAVIIDEAQYLSNIQSKRTIAVYGKFANYSNSVLDYARPKSVWIFSGTIQRRDIRDTYPHLKCLFPHVINRAMGRPDDAPIRKKDFEQQFLLWGENDMGFPVPTGNNNEEIPKLRAALKPYFLGRRKRDVAPELGDVTQLDLALPVDDDDPHAKAASDPKFGHKLAEELYGHTSLSTMLALSETAAEERRILGLIKTRPAAQWATDFLEGGDELDKLVIFAWHRDVIFEMAERLKAYGPLVVMGGTKDEDRNRAVHLFQNDLNYRVFIGQTIAASTSITLTAASTVLTIEPDWLPHNDYQAVSRVHRLGQTEPIINYRCFSDGTIDARILARANARYRDFLILMDGLIEAPTNAA